MPVNMPTHGHGHGYSDLNFLIPELVSGVQFSKGPYFADQGDFTTAGSANINYANALDRPLMRLGRRRRSGLWPRALRPRRRRSGTGRLLGALERAAQRRALGAARRLSRRSTAFCATAGATRVNGFADRRAWAIAARGTRPTRSRARAVASGADRALRRHRRDRWRRVVALQRDRSSGSGRAATPATKVTAFGLASDLNLFSNFTYFLDDPVNGDQFQQADRRLVSWREGHVIVGWATGADRLVQTSVGVQMRNDDISERRPLSHRPRVSGSNTIRQDAVVQTSVGRLCRRTKPRGRRGCARSEACASTAIASASTPARRPIRRHDYAASREPEGRRRRSVRGRAPSSMRMPGSGSTATTPAARRSRWIPSTGDPADRVTPLARARGAEVGIRTRQGASPADEPRALDAQPRLRADLRRRRRDDGGRPSQPPVRHRVGKLLLPAPVADLRRATSPSRAGASRTMTSLATSFQAPSTPWCRAVSPWTAFTTSSAACGGACFGPRPLVEDNSVRSRVDEPRQSRGGLPVHTRSVGSPLDVFNVLDARDSDIDYFYTSRLPGEPAGRRRRRALPSDAAAHRPPESDRRVLTRVTPRASRRTVEDPRIWDLLDCLARKRVASGSSAPGNPLKLNPRIFCRRGADAGPTRFGRAAGCYHPPNERFLLPRGSARAVGHPGHGDRCGGGHWRPGPAGPISRRSGPGQRRRDGDGPPGQLHQRPQARRFRPVRGRRPAACDPFPARRHRRRGAEPAPGPAARHQRQHAGRHRPGPDGRHPLPQGTARGARRHAGGLRHRGPRGALRPGRPAAPDRAHPDPQDRRLDGALRRDGHLPGRHARAGRPQDPGRLHRRRRHAQRADVHRHRRHAQGLRRHRLRHRLSAAPADLGAQRAEAAPAAAGRRHRRADVLPHRRRRR